MERDALLTVRVPSEVKAAVQRAAGADHGRSMSGMVVRILSEWCAEKGYLKPPGGSLTRATSKGRG